MQVTKFQLCKKILGYKLKNKITREEIAERIQLSKAETEDILFCEIEKFTLDRLFSYASKLLDEVNIVVAPKNISHYAWAI